MSYSFSVRGRTKSETIQKMMDEMDKVVQNQPEHMVDKTAAINTAVSFINLIEYDQNFDIHVQVQGSITRPDIGVTAVNVSVSVHKVKHEQH